MEVRATRPLVAEHIRETWVIHHLTDLHIDDPDHLGELLAQRVEEIRQDPRALWVGGGDYGSLILPGDKRFGSGGHLRGEWADAMSRLPDHYLDRAAEILEPIADKCIGLVAGNHEATIGRNYHRGLVPELASRLGDPTLYLGDRGWMIVRWQIAQRRLSLSLFAFHGWSSGRLGGRKLIQAERDLGAWDADVFLLGHDHQPLAHLWATEEVKHHPRSGWTLHRRPRAVINGGAWVLGQKPPTSEREKLGWDRASRMPSQSWGEGKNFRPQPVAHPVLLAHLDFGCSNTTRRPAAVELEVRMRAETVTFDG